MNVEVCLSHSSAPRCCYIGRTLVLESEGSKPIPFGPLFFVHVLIWCICAWYEWPFWNNIYVGIQICMFLGEIWQVKVFHIAARIHLRCDYSFAQWPVILVAGHCMSPFWWGWWPPAVHIPSTHATWQGWVVSAGPACTYPLMQSSAATWGQVGFSLRGLIASQNIFSHRIVTQVISLYSKPPLGNSFPVRLR